MSHPLNHHKVIIIGGGISGLKAAQELNKHKIDFKLFEARNRLGGRLYTNRTGLHPYDLGASWHHDTLANPLFDEVVKSGQYDLYFDDFKLYYFGKNLEPDQFDKIKVEQVVKELEKFIELEYFESIDKKDISLHEIVMDYLYKQRKVLTKEQIMYVPQFIRHLELWHGVSWDHMSAKFSLVDNVGRNCIMRNGYDEITSKIADELPNGSIELNKVVRKIKRGSIIEVELSNGSKHTCEYLIVTVPQSILQLDPKEEGGIEWEPKLNKSIQGSLNNMSFGKLGKFIFEFEEPFWKHIDSDRFVAISNPEPGSEVIYQDLLKNIKPKAFKQDETDPKPWEFPVLMLNMHKINNVPSLLCFTQGPLTEYLEANPNKAWSYMKPILATLVKCQDIPSPANIISSNWTIDPYSRGSYAACLPGNDPTELVIHLTKGMDNVRFAGEHTILDGAGAVHGAWMSGKREAEYVLIKVGLIEGELDEW